MQLEKVRIEALWSVCSRWTSWDETLVVPSSHKVNECSRNASNRARNDRSDENIVRDVCESRVCSEEPLMSEQTHYLLMSSVVVCAVSEVWLWNSNAPSQKWFRSPKKQKNHAATGKSSTKPSRVHTLTIHIQRVILVIFSSKSYISSILTFMIVCRLSYVKWRLVCWHLNTLVVLLNDLRDLKTVELKAVLFLGGALLLRGCNAHFHLKDV